MIRNIHDRHLGDRNIDRAIWECPELLGIVHPIRDIPCVASPDCSIDKRSRNINPNNCSWS